MFPRTKVSITTVNFGQGEARGLFGELGRPPKERFPVLMQILFWVWGAPKSIFGGPWDKETMNKIAT